MRNACRHTLVLLVISAMLLAPGIVLADNDVIYAGETPTNGITTYSGANASDSLWDYVYSIANVGNDGPPHADEPDYWAIVADYQPDQIFDEDGLWESHWDDRIVTDEYGGYFNGSALIDRPAVIWHWGGDLQSIPQPGTFHFQSTYSPEFRPWVVSGDGTAYDGAGTEWSANPEPASMALYGLSLLGVGYWRRRKTA